MQDILDMHSVDPKLDEYLARVFRMAKSYQTQRSYKVSLNKFFKFLGTKNKQISELLLECKQKKVDPIVVLDEFYTYMSKQNMRNRSIASYLCVVKDFLNFHELHIYSEDVKQRFRTPKTEVFYEEGLTKQILNRILHNSVPKLQAAILVACSSGIRVGELVQLRISDIDFTTSPTTIKIRRDTTKTRETRFTHITNEASKILSDYITKNLKNQLSSDPYIFMKYQGEEDTFSYYKAVISSRGSLMNMLRRAVLAVPELAMKNEGGGYQIHFHAFRKWFKTQVTNAQQSDFAEALIGHKSLKLVYYKQNTQDRQKMYKKLESNLTISDFTNFENTMEELQEKLSQVEIELEKVKQWKEITVKYQKKA